MQKTCTIAIVVWNNRDVTKRCLESLSANTAYPNNVLIIDNGSGPETADFLENFCGGRAGFRLHRFEKNLGYLSAANYALSNFDTPYICLLNNDTILTKGWLDECIAVAESRKEIGIVSPTTNEISKVFTRRYKTGRIKNYLGRSIEVNSGLGSCFIVKKEVVEKISVFDPVYGDGYFEEVDYCFKARGAGFYSMMALGAYITHLSSASFDKIPSEERNALWHKNRAILESRWGRSSRILFFIDKKCDEAGRQKIKEYLLKQCRARAIVDLYSRFDTRWIEGVHFNIRCKRYFFAGRLMKDILVRFKKKSYDIVKF